MTRGLDMRGQFFANLKNYSLASVGGVVWVIVFMG